MPASPTTTTYLGLPRYADDATAALHTHLTAIVDQIDAKFAPWTAYVPVWTQSDGTVLAIGNGVLTGRYRQLGKTVDWMTYWERGSTTNTGTSGMPYGFTLPPVTPRAWNQHGGSLAMTKGATTFFGGAVFPTTISTFGLIVGDLGRVAADNPGGSHTVGNWMTARGTYEAA